MGRRTWLCLALAFGIAGALASVASAGKVFTETIHDEYGFVLEDFCDEAGLDVSLEGVLDLRVRVVPHGPNGVEYFLSHGRQVETLSANGVTLTSVATVTEKDKLVTDNGDGTLTVLILSTGNAVLYGPDGKAIARNPGQLRFEILIYPDGSFDRLGVVKGSTGRNDDFCAAAVPALTA
jgi:hypothetical protein